MLATLIPLLSLQAWYLYEGYRAKQASEFRENLEMAKAVAGTFNMFVEDVLHQESAIGIHLATPPRPLSVERMNGILAANKQAFPTVRDFAWLTPTGRIIASSLAKTIGVDVAERGYIRKITRGSKWSVSNLLPARSTGEPIFSICSGIRDRNGKLLGIALAAVDADKLSTILKLDLSRKGVISILDDKAMMVDSYPRRDVKWSERNVLAKRPAIGRALHGKVVTGVFPGLFAESKRIVACVPAGPGWVACVSRSEREVMAPIRYRTIQESIFSLLLTAAIFCAAFLLSRIISDPIGRLGRHALVLGTQTRTEPIEFKGPVELLELASAFNAMAEKIGDREERLRNSEEKYRELVENANCVILRMGLDGTIVYLNEFGQSLFGYTEQEIFGRHVVGAIVPEMDSAGRDLNLAIADILRNPHQHAISEYENVCKNGDRLWVLWANRAILDESGSISGVLSIGADITARKRAEENLRNSEREKAGILGSLRNVAVGYLDTRMRVIWTNSAVKHVFGLAPEEIEGKKCYEAIHARLQPCDNCPVRTSLQTGKPGEGETAAEDGRVWLVSSNPVKDSSGKVTNVVISSMDITARKEMEEALRGEIAERKQAEAMLRLDEARLQALWRLSQMSESSPDQIAEFALELLVGLTESQVGWIGFLDEAETVLTSHVWPTLDSPGPQMPLGAEELFGEAIRERRVVVVNDCKNVAFGNFPVNRIAVDRVMVVPVFDGERVAAIAGVGNKASAYDFSDARQLTLLLDGMWNIIEREQTEKHLRESESLAAMGRAMAALAHDMKTPLIAIGGFTRLAQKRLQDNSPVQELLEIAVKETARMEAMVKNMLDFSRPLELECASTDVGALVAECMKLVEPLATERKVRLSNRMASGPRLFARLDAARMKQVLINILTNGVQASPEGEQVIVDSHAKGEKLEVSVVDSGCGIARDKREQIFSPFYTSKKDGAGLGLPIVKKIVEAHRGRIEIVDNPEKGITFRVEIPIR